MISKKKINISNLFIGGYFKTLKAALAHFEIYFLFEIDFLFYDNFC